MMNSEDFGRSGPPGMAGLQPNYFNSQSSFDEAAVGVEGVDPDVSANDDRRNPSEHQQVKMAVLHKLVRGEKLTYTERSMALAAVIVSCGGLIFGYELGAMAGSLAQLQEHFSMNAYQEGAAVAILYAGQVLGGGLAGVLTDKIGRWRTCQIQTLIFAVGSMVLGTSHTIAPVLAGRFLIGVAAAFASISALPYLREIAPHRYGGRFASTYEVFVVFGILLANVISVFVYDKRGSWRHIFLLPVAFAAVQAAAMWFIPESPSWLIQKGLTDRATAALRRIYNDPEVVSDELNALKLTNITKQHGRFGTVLSLLRQYYKLLLVVSLVSLLSAVCGVSVFVAYLPLLFVTVSPIGVRQALLMNIFVGTARFLATVASISLLDSPKGGRRRLLLIGIAMICVGQLILAESFHHNGDVLPVRARWQMVVGTIISVSGQGVGFGVVTSLLQTEMFPTLVRARAMSVAMTAQNLALYSINVSFPHLLVLWGAESLFFCYTVAAVVSFAAVFLLVPETKGKRPAEILAAFSVLTGVSTEDTSRMAETGTSMQKGQAVTLVRGAEGAQGLPIAADTQQAVVNPMRDGEQLPGGGFAAPGQTPPQVTLYPATFLRRKETSDSDF